MPSTSIRKSLETRIQEYQFQLMETIEGEAAVKYLVSRGLSKETVESFRLGYVHHPEDGDEDYQGRLVIPYLTPSGPVTMRFRAIGNASLKYLTIAGDQTRVFNPGALRHSKLYVCEGEFDALSMAEAGLPAVGVPGVNAWQGVWKRLFRYRDVTVLGDSDDAGQGRVFAEKLQTEISARIRMMPEGHDVNSYLVEAGVEELKRYVGA